MINIKDNMKVAFGTWAIGGGDSWGESDDKESICALECALDLGFSYFDTAPAYGNGKAETLLGKVVKGRRDKVIIATKCGLQWGDDGSMLHKERDGVKVWRCLRKSAIKRQVEDSLKRLDTDYIDILLTHWQCPLDPISETIEALEELKKEGKILSWGSSNNTKESLDGYFKSESKPIVLQERWSLLERGNDSLLHFAEENGVIFQAYSSMERGLLTGKVRVEDVIKGSAKKNDVWFKKENIVKVNSALEPLKEIAKGEGVPLHVLLSSYALSLSPSFSVLLGARKTEQVKENALLLSYEMKDDIKREIERKWIAPKKEDL